MVCLFNNNRDFKINPKSISISIDLRPEYDVTAIQRIATNPNLLNITEWRDSHELINVLPSKHNAFSIYKAFNESSYYVSDRLAFLSYLRHAVGADLDVAIAEHTANYTKYNSPENTDNDMYWISEYNLTTIYRFLPEYSPLLTPYQWVHSEHINSILGVINNFKNFNTGMAISGNADSLILYVQSSLIYLEYIKYCLGNDLNAVIDGMVKKINTVYAA